MKNIPKKLTKKDEELLSFLEKRYKEELKKEKKRPTRRYSVEEMRDQIQRHQRETQRKKNENKNL
jgi:hypothetical protein